MAKQQVSNKDANATQAAIKRADDLGVNLADVKGSGDEGRVLIGDVENFAENEGITTDTGDTATATRAKAGKEENKPAFRARLLTANKTPGPGFAISHEGQGISISTRRFQNYTEAEMNAITKEAEDRYGLAEDDFEIIPLEDATSAESKPVSMTDLDKERRAPVYGKPEAGATGSRVGDPETGPGTPESGEAVPQTDGDTDNPPVG